VPWTPVEADGSFVIRDGWQCENANCVLLLDVDSGCVVDVAFADAAGEARFHDPSRCDLACEVELAPGATAEGTAIRFEREGFYGGPRRPIPTYTPSAIPKHLSLPRGKYYVRDASGVQSDAPLASIDCTGPAAELALTIEPHFHIVGILEGEMTGPVAGVDVEFRDARGRNVGIVRSDARGAFDTRVFGAPPIEACARWRLPNNGTQFPAESIAHVSTPEANVRLVRAEGQLVLNVERTPIPAEHTAITVSWLDPDSGDVLSDLFEWPGKNARSVEAFVAPGRYRVRRGGLSNGMPIFLRDITIARGETARVDIATCPVGILRVHI
jgi:hypothetical protein